MKTLIDPVITVTGDKITICATIKDMLFNSILVTRTSHHAMNPANLSHPRFIVASSSAVFVESGGDKFAIPNDVITAIAAAAEPRTTFAPLLSRASVPGAVKIVSEIPHTVQWQVADKPDGEWADIEGANSETLDEAKVDAGKWMRCVSENATGKTISQPAMKQ